MEAVFTRFFSVLKANTPPSGKRYSSRKFLSLFLILFLAVGNAWGQEITHTNPATITVANRVFLDLQGTPSNVTVGTDNYSNYGPGYFIQNKTTLSWWSFSGTFKSSSSSYSNASNAVGFQSPGSSSASEFYQKLQMREGSDRMTQMDFYVKGTTSVGFQWKNGGTSNKYLTFTIYEMNVTGTTATDESTPVAIVTGNTASSSVQYAATEILDGSKYYHVQVTPKGTSNIDFYGLTFKHVPAAPATEYSVTYDLNGGTGTEPTQGKVAENGTFTVASAEGVTPPAGKEFAGWSDGTNTYNAGDTYTMGAAPVTFIAQWQAETPKYDVTYDLNGGTGTAPTQGKVAENGIFTVASAEGITPPTGKEFAGWSDGTTTYAAGATYTMGAAAVTFTAQWKAVPTVIFDWTAANSSNIEADNTDLSNATYGTLTVGTSVMGRLLGTNTMSKSDVGYKLGYDDVCIEIQGTLSFEEGDEVVIIGKNGGNGERSFAIAPETATAANAESVINTSVIGAQTENSEYKVVITATQAGTKMRVFRLAGKSMYVKSIKVIRPAQKEILSTNITLSAVTVNTEAISAEDLATLKAAYKLDLTSEYAEAPTIAFTKQTVITYEDATTKTKTEAIEVVAAKVDGKWQAQTEINAITYTVTALIPATYTVIYKDGETILASETVKVGEHPTAAGVTTNPHYSLSWKLGDEAVELSNVTGTADQEIILTAVWKPKYAATIDFTTYVQEERLTKSLADVLKDGNHNYICGGTFNKSEWGATSENAAYQGYKFKDSDVYIEFLLRSGKRATFLFGNYGSTGTIKVGAAEATDCTLSDSKYVVNATSEDVLVRFTTGGTGTVTLKSITIGDIPTISDDATLKDLKVNGTTIAGFNSATTIYYLTVPYGTEVANMPKITEATPNHASAAAVIYPEEGPEWTDEYGGCYLQQVVVTAADGISKGYYHVRTTVDAKQGVSLIKATHTGEKTADVTGYIGGSVDKNTQGGGKLGGTDQYFGIKLAKGTFLKGDVVTIYASTISTKVQIFSDKGETMINEGVFNGNYYTYTLTDATEWIYLYRTETAGSAMNPTLGYIEVQRYMAPFIESFVIGEAEGTIDQANKTIAVEVPAGTDVTALTPSIVAWANGGAKVTPTGAQDFTSPVTYKVSSAYAEDGTTEYTVTVTEAAASADATLATLTYNGTNITLVPDQYTYDIELPKGTTVVPTVTYTTNHTGATADMTDAADLPGATTIIVTAEDGTTKQNYTINFTVSRAISYVIYDGSVQQNIESRTGNDATGFSWSMGSNVTISGSEVPSSWNGKNYKHVIKGFKPNESTNNIITIVIPAGYLAKITLVGTTNSEGTERSLFIATSASRNKEDAMGDYIITSSDFNVQGFTTDYLQAGTYYLGSTEACRLYELSVVLYQIDYERDVRQGYYGTICLPNKGQMIGAAVYEIAYMDYKDGAPYKIYFDEILNGKMEAGVPYVFLPNEGYNQLMVTYTAIIDAPATKANGLHGFIGTRATDEFPIPGGEGNYIIQNNQYREVLAEADARIVSNRAYIKLSEIPGYNNPLYVAPAPAPGRKRIAMGTTGAQVATGVDQVQGGEAPTKMIINGQLFILRGEKMYDAQGKLVK